MLCWHWAASAFCAPPAKSDTLSGSLDEVVPTEALLAHSTQDCTWYRQLLPPALAEQPLSTARAGALHRLLCENQGEKRKKNGKCSISESRHCFYLAAFSFVLFWSMFLHAVCLCSRNADCVDAHHRLNLLVTDEVAVSVLINCS